MAARGRLNIGPNNHIETSMNPTNFFNSISLNEKSAIPKYMQVADSIVEAINDGEIEAAQFLPSLNQLNFNLEVSRGTARKIYHYLKIKGVLDSVPGKGYYLKETPLKKNRRVFLLFNQLSPQNDGIYDALTSALGDDTIVDLDVYNNDYFLFRKIMRQVQSAYSHYVIMPHFQETDMTVYSSINQFHKGQLIILGKKPQGILGKYASVLENHEKNIYQVMEKALLLLRKYHTIKIVQPMDNYFPIEILNGLKRFCTIHNFAFCTVNDFRSALISEGEVFITLSEEDLIVLIEKIRLLKLAAGNQVGVISYHETPIKKIVLNGITTISADAQQTGHMIAQLIKEKSYTHLEVPFHLTVRPSL